MNGSLGYPSCRNFYCLMPCSLPQSPEGRLFGIFQESNRAVLLGGSRPERLKQVADISSDISFIQKFSPNRAIARLRTRAEQYWPLIALWVLLSSTAWMNTMLSSILTFLACSSSSKGFRTSVIWLSGQIVNDRLRVDLILKLIQYP